MQEVNLYKAARGQTYKPVRTETLDKPAMQPIDVTNMSLKQLLNELQRGTQIADIFENKVVKRIFSSQ